MCVLSVLLIQIKFSSLNLIYFNVLFEIVAFHFIEIFRKVWIAAYVHIFENFKEKKESLSPQFRGEHAK